MAELTVGYVIDCFLVSDGFFVILFLGGYGSIRLYQTGQKLNADIDHMIWID